MARPRAPRRQNLRGEGHELRASLVGAAKEVLQRSGRPEDVTIRAVAQTAGVSPASVYLHFPTRDALVGAAVRELFRDLGTATREAAAGRRTPRTRLKAISVAYLNFAEERPGAYSAMISDTEGEVAERPFDAMPGAAGLGAFTEQIRAAAPLADAPATALHLWAALHGHVLLRRAVPQLPWPSPEHTVDDLVAAFLPPP